ncbi:hypothetical protein THARTR1_09209 [Trichoderma harzianum]|uniref:NAD-dependent epimerase/dehydratase domain-containing protein n=1 Tax=Trichoderma harzianum TaxID=5544 RepID=A0A2K0TX10_TRIHA|nr:hypothetical protein THARTR1_09209 [Trichoderma harzianum]
MAIQRVLVTGANGFLGESVCRKFCLEGWETYGLVRSADKAAGLLENEIIPLVGAPGDLGFLEQIKDVEFDAIISTTEDMIRYEAHFTDIIALVISVSAAANRAGKKPLLLFTTGAKDTGPSGLVSSKNFVVTDELTIPHNALPMHVIRHNTIQKAFDHATNFHAILVRPTLIYGRSASWYGTILHQAATGDQIVLYGSEDVVYHGVHVDDVAEAYFLLATKVGSRGHGELYNIANDEYETLGAIAEAVSKEYGGQHTITFKPVESGKLYQEITGFSHAMSAEKLKRAAGWKQKKPGFIEGLKVYSASYNELVKKGDARALRIIEYQRMADVKTEDLPL